MSWKDRFLRMLVGGEIVAFGDPLDKELLGVVLDRIESDAGLQRRIESLSPSELEREVGRLLEEARQNL